MMRKGLTDYSTVIISDGNSVTGGGLGRKTGAFDVEIGSAFKSYVSPLGSCLITGSGNAVNIGDNVFKVG